MSISLSSDDSGYLCLRFRFHVVDKSIRQKYRYGGARRYQRWNPRGSSAGNDPLSDPAVTSINHKIDNVRQIFPRLRLESRYALSFSPDTLPTIEQSLIVNIDMFLPSYVNSDFTDLEHRQDPVADIILTEEERENMLPS